MSFGPTLRVAIALSGGLLACLLLAEGALRVLPTGGDGTDFIDGYGSAAPLRQVPGSTLHFSRDWDFLYAHRDPVNDLGFHGHCERAASGGRQAWVIGDSFVAAWMLDSRDTLAARLQAQVGSSRSVCAVGLPGAPGTEFLATLESQGGRQAGDAWVIVLNSGDIAESAGEQTGPGWHHFSPSLDGTLSGTPRARPSRWLQAARRSQLYRYLSYNLSASLALTQLKVQCTQLLSTLSLQPSSRARPEEALSQEAHQRLVTLWAQGLMQRAHKAQAQPIVVLNAFDPRRSSEANRRVEAQRLQDIEAKLGEAGVPVVRVVDAFSGPRCRTEGSCYLFRDGHWTALGHQLVAEAVHRRLADAATHPVQARSD